MHKVSASVWVPCYTAWGQLLHYLIIINISTAIWVIISELPFICMWNDHTYYSILDREHKNKFQALQPLTKLR